MYCIIGLILVVLNIIHDRFQDRTATKIGIAAVTAASSKYIDLNNIVKL